MNENVETINDVVSDAPQVVEVGFDYSSELQEIISLQRDTIIELRYQNEILFEQNNGLSCIVNYQNAFYCIAIACIVVKLLWDILSKWFFRGC